MSGRHSRQTGADRGFSLIEIIVVVFIGLMITTLALPNMLVAIANLRLRGNISTLSGIYQNCRMMAVMQNKTMTTHFNTGTAGIMAFVKLATDTGPLVKTDTQVHLQRPIIQHPSSASNGGPADLTTASLGFTAGTGDPSFNSRGLPCFYSLGTCSNQGFVTYFRDTRRTGMQGWAAVSVSPAGRIKRWFWNGSTWGD